MKTQFNYGQEHTTYDITDIPAELFRRLREGAIKNLANEMAEHYQFPTQARKMFRNQAKEMLEGLDSEVWPGDENVQEAIKQFKRQARHMSTHGHFRGGEYRTASK